MRCLPAREAVIASAFPAYRWASVRRYPPRWAHCVAHCPTHPIATEAPRTVPGPRLPAPDAANRRRQSLGGVCAHRGNGSFQGALHVPDWRRSRPTRHCRAFAGPGRVVRTLLTYERWWWYQIQTPNAPAKSSSHGAQIAAPSPSRPRATLRQGWAFADRVSRRQLPPRFDEPPVAAGGALLLRAGSDNGRGGRPVAAAPRRPSHNPIRAPTAACSTTYSTDIGEPGPSIAWIGRSTNMDGTAIAAAVAATTQAMPMTNSTKMTATIR